MSKEARARIKINDLLKEAGWRFFDDANGRANIVLENNVKITERDVNELGENFEKSRNGFIDFLLLDDKGFPFIVLEAKSEDKNALAGKEQARRYAQSQGCRFVILSNGNSHYLWNLQYGNPYPISIFPSLESFESFASFKPNPEGLTREVVEKNYTLPPLDIQREIVARIEHEHFLVEGNRELIKLYEVKIKKVIDRVWSHNFIARRVALCPTKQSHVR